MSSLSLSMSPARRRLALFSLTLGGFGIGATEFVAMGLLPNIARDLLPSLSASNPAEAEARVGLIISAYALGVVVGAPTIAATTARIPRRRLLLLLLLAFTVFTVLSALSPSYAFVMVARFEAALPHGAYFGIASLVAAEIMGPGKSARGVSMVLGGLTVANVVGVPAITWVGQLYGWRVAYLVVASIFFLALVSVFFTVPGHAPDPQASVRSELSAFRIPRFWLAFGFGAIGSGGFFAFYSYISPMVTNLTAFDEGIVPWILVTVGLGMTVGNIVGGRVSDRSIRLGLLIPFIGMLCSLVFAVLTATWVSAVFVGGFLLGWFNSMLSPALQTRLVSLAPRSPSIAAAMNHSSLNIGNSLGAFLGGSAIALTLDYRAQLYVGIILCAIGLVLCVWSLQLDRNPGARA